MRALRSQRIWSVGELIGSVSRLLDQGYSGIRVEGEVTNVSRSARGHIYFSLKDDRAAVDCVMFGSKAERVPFQLEDGLVVIAGGSLTIYAPRGRFQMVVESLQPQGQGALQLAFEQLKKRLAEEGLFAAERKRPLPALPQRVGIVTSLTGAALRDMLKVLRRHPHLQVVVAGARVQGEGAGRDIASALRRLSASGLVDVVIVGRGGGSLEDLQAFNEEVVARAVVSCRVPVISGVGHEVDLTISDLVADVRAATPTQAAEIVVAQLERQERRLADAEARLLRDLRRHLQLAHTRLAGLEGSRGLARLPQRIELLRARLQRAERLEPLLQRRLQGGRQRLTAADRLEPLLQRLLRSSRQRLAAAELALRRLPGQVAAGGARRLLDSRCRQLAQLMHFRLRQTAATLAAHERSLLHLSPRKVLQRGYSITRSEGETRPLGDAAQAPAGTVLITTLARGTLRSLVQGERRPRQPSAEQGRLPQQRSLFAESAGETGRGEENR